MITSILIANRGEIACRIIRTCRRLGIRAIAVYSDADAGARHVRMADEALRIGPAPAAESYLDGAAIVAAARRAGADAIHPGYGFLAENAGFAQAVAAAGIVFIGPPAAAIAAMGNKRAAKELVAAAGVPTVPGYGGAAQDDATLAAEAARIGLPLMVKAAAGGGGKGMRLVADLSELPAALAAARREALAAFGSDELILERAVAEPRHIEVQIFGDDHGALIHLGERECSIQRRHQKIIEEAPSPALDETQRAAIGAAAVAAGRAVGYRNAGTVEFLLDADGNFYFLEMNTRLQVEHPVTEEVFGPDLVEWQIRAAEGQPLPLRQEDLRPRGHAIEARVYAENPAAGFLPATGPVLLWREPAGEGLRVESGIQTGDTVGLHYDPMLAKIIAHGPDRPTALRRLARALETTALLGCANNLAFLRAVALHPAHRAAELSTAFLERHAADLAPADDPGATALALVAATLLQWTTQIARSPYGGYWRNNPNGPQRYRYAAAGHEYEVALHPAGAAAAMVEVSGDGARLFAGRAAWDAPGEASLALELDGHRQIVLYAASGRDWWLQARGAAVHLRDIGLLPEPRRRPDEAGSLRAPMPGAVTAVLVEPGATVEAGAPLLKLEAMKMEHTIRATVPGTVTAVFCAPGDTVQADTELIALKPA